MKKGMFFTLSIVLLIIFALFLVRSASQVQQLEEQFRIERSQLYVIDEFIRELDDREIEKYLKLAFKATLIARTKDGPIPFDFNEILDIMDNSYSNSMGKDYIEDTLTTDELLSQSFKTLTFSFEDSATVFGYRILSMRQISFNTIEVDFEVDYSFTAFGNTWSRVGKQITIEYDVYSLTHPNGLIIVDSWIPDSSICLIHDLVSDADDFCNFNIVPPS